MTVLLDMLFLINYSTFSDHFNRLCKSVAALRRGAATIVGLCRHRFMVYKNDGRNVEDIDFNKSTRWFSLNRHLKIIVINLKTNLTYCIIVIMRRRIVVPQRSLLSTRQEGRS